MSKLLSYGDAPESLAWDAIVNAILTDPFLNDPEVQPRPPRITSYGDGIAESKEAKPEPDVADLPYARITHGGLISSGWVNSHEHLVYFRISIGLFVQGDDPRDILNFNHMIRQAIFPQDVARRATVFSDYRSIIGFATPKADQAVGGLLVMGKSQHGLKAECGYAVGIHVKT